MHKLGWWELSPYCWQDDERTLRSFYGPHLSHSFILCFLMEGGFMGFMGGKTLVMDQFSLDILFVILVVWLSIKEPFNGAFGWKTSTIFGSTNHKQNHTRTHRHLSKIQPCYRFPLMFLPCIWTFLSLYHVYIYRLSIFFIYLIHLYHEFGLTRFIL